MKVFRTEKVLFSCGPNEFDSTVDADDGLIFKFTEIVFYGSRLLSSFKITVGHNKKLHIGKHYLSKWENM